jgi:hypothetical protein
VIETVLELYPKNDIYPHILDNWVANFIKYNIDKSYVF